MLQDKVQIIVKGEDKTDSIRAFDVRDGKTCITYYDGKTFSYNTMNVQIKHSALSNKTAFKRFEYLRRIAEIVGLQDPRSGNILASRYSKIDFVSEESILSAFLTGKLNISKQSRTDSVVYPFGFNISQKSAIDSALKSQFTIVEGPPGTGKTQTILNIIANAVMRDESIAIVSSNNSATANVLEKLKKYQIDFIAAYLGNSENKAKFMESQKPLPDMSSWKLSAGSRYSIYHTMQNLSTVLNVMLEKRNELSRIRQEHDAIELEYAHFCEFCKYCDYTNELSFRYFKNSISASVDALKLWFRCEKYIVRKKMPGFIGRLVNRFLYGVVNKAFYSDHNIMIAICQKRWYITRISELAGNISILKTELSEFKFDEKMNEYSSMSVQLFRDYLSEKYKNNVRNQFELNDLWKKSAIFINEYPVILSTTYSLRSSLSNKVMYDYVIIDESSQVDLATGALALSCARKAVIVGDLKQLPNVVDSETARKTDTVFETEYDLPEDYRYKNHSLLLAVIGLFPDIPRTLLREHYRCSPEIIGFCNQKFYNNQLIILTERKLNRKPLIVYKTVPGNHARKHVNQRQIDVIKNEIIPQQNLTDGNTSIGIVTPYRNQTNALQEAFSGTGIQADTVDKFQGRENDVIILSTVDNEISEFADDANRLNVAVSRAIEQLIVVVSSGDDMRDKNIGDLIRYVEYNNCEIINSNVHSVFDYLYSGYREKRNELLQKQRKISKFDSENLMYNLIRDVLNNERFMRFEVAVHVPLKMILRDLCGLDANETRYARNILTHVDFLIFEKIGKTPRLIIEVDGIAFHEKGTYQAERDLMKNRILEKYGLPYKRFRTNESGEYERLANALNEI